MPDLLAEEPSLAADARKHAVIPPRATTKTGRAGFSLRNSHLVCMRIR